MVYLPKRRGGWLIINMERGGILNHINKLILQAKKAFNPAVHSAICFIDCDLETGKWTADPRTWDGVYNSGMSNDTIPADWKREYNTLEEAKGAVNALFQSIGISDPNKAIIFIMDYGLED